MRKLQVLIFGLLIAVCCMADEKPVSITPTPHEELGPGNRAPVLIPSVTYEDDNVFIYAPYYIDSMDVVIYDASGEAIYTYTSAMVVGKNTIVLPTTVSEEKYAIELNYGSFCLIGYFGL